MNDVEYGPLSADDDEWNELIEDASVTTLQSLLDAGVRQMQYVYDLGDYWEHSVVVESVAASLPEIRYPQFLGGELRCPPEDCGGAFGYSEFLRKLSGRQNKIPKTTLDWYGRPYDADNIGEDKILTRLGKMAATRRKR